MQLDFGSEIPIYMQLAQSIEDDIVNGIFLEDQQIPSTTEISLHYKINPATVGKGFNLLVDEGILYKKRGVGMFVAKGAKQQLLRKRKNLFFDRYIKAMLEEAQRLCISKEELMRMIEEGSEDERN
ncbi:MAG: GntR family transcriptional regulator [Clostridium sp.]